MLLLSQTLASTYLQSKVFYHSGLSFAKVVLDILLPTTNFLNDIQVRKPPTIIIHYNAQSLPVLPPPSPKELVS